MTGICIAGSNGCWLVVDDDDSPLTVCQDVVAIDVVVVVAVDVVVADACDKLVESRLV